MYARLNIFLLTVMMLAISFSGCSNHNSNQLSHYGIQPLSKVDTSLKPELSKINKEFKNNYKASYIKSYGSNNYQLGTPLLYYEINSEVLKTFSVDHTIKEQMIKSESYLFPVIADNKIFSDCQVEVGRDQYQYFLNANLFPEIYAVLQVNNLSLKDCYLVSLAYGPKFLFTQRNGSEICVPLYYNLTDDDYRIMKELTTEKVKQTLVLVKEKLDDPETYQGNKDDYNAPCFDIGKLFDIWYNFDKEYLNYND